MPKVLRGVRQRDEDGSPRIRGGGARVPPDVRHGQEGDALLRGLPVQGFGQRCGSAPAGEAGVLHRDPGTQGGGGCGDGGQSGAAFLLIILIILIFLLLLLRFLLLLLLAELKMDGARPWGAAPPRGEKRGGRGK